LRAAGITIMTVQVGREGGREGGRASCVSTSYQQLILLVNPPSLPPSLPPFQTEIIPESIAALPLPDGYRYRCLHEDEVCVVGMKEGGREGGREGGEQVTTSLP